MNLKVTFEIFKTKKYSIYFKVFCFILSVHEHILNIVEKGYYKSTCTLTHPHIISILQNNRFEPFQLCVCSWLCCIYFHIAK